jgi:hypothetical protein
MPRGRRQDLILYYSHQFNYATHQYYQYNYARIDINNLRLMNILPDSELHEIYQNPPHEYSECCDSCSTFYVSLMKEYHRATH